MEKKKIRALHIGRSARNERSKRMTYVRMVFFFLVSFKRRQILSEHHIFVRTESASEQDMRKRKTNCVLVHEHHNDVLAVFGLHSLWPLLIFLLVIICRSGRVARCLMCICDTAAVHYIYFFAPSSSPQPLSLFLSISHSLVFLFYFHLFL